MYRAPTAHRQFRRVAAIAVVLGCLPSATALARSCGASPAACAETHPAMPQNEQAAAGFADRAHALKAAGDLTGAEKEATQALFHAPSRARLWYQRALIRMANGQYIPAAADLNVALRYDPTMAAAYVARGDCYRSLGALDQAVADATQALQIDPQSADAFSNRAYARLRQGKLDEAIADAERAVSIDPKNARGYMTRGLALDRKPNERARDRVIADIAKAFELDPSLKELAVLKGVRQRLGL